MTSNHIYNKIWDKLLTNSQNFSGGVVEIWKYISNFVQLFMIDENTYQF